MPYVVLTSSALANLAASNAQSTLGLSWIQNPRATVDYVNVNLSSNFGAMAPITVNRLVGLSEVSVAVSETGTPTFRQATIGATDVNKQEYLTTYNGCIGNAVCN
jgi:hypothetical protein